MQEIAFDREEKESNTPLHPTMKAIERDWADLSPELVCIIARKVVDIFDFIRFRAVCKTWRSVTTIADLSPQFPWILKHNHGPDLNFYSMAFNKSFTIHAPKFSDTNFLAPCHGAMLVSPTNGLSWSMINPLNNSEVSLPLRYFYYQWIGPRNFRSRDYLVIKEFEEKLYVFKPGDEKWTIMEGKEGYLFYLNNLLFVINYYSHFTEVVNLSTNETIFVVPPPWDTSTLPILELESKLSRYPSIIESSGEVLYVTYASETNKFEIYRLEDGNDDGYYRWVEVTSIGDRILFLDFKDSCGDFSLKATDFCRFNFKVNSIYFIRPHKKRSKGYAYSIERYDIESAETECIQIHEGLITWYLPDLNHI
ncbi:F-box protein skip23 [Rhynchospora pubera]|uniref:F-box protein skip23 n=1 Tax=Rhynchospora pubera TaxID=906938 RepID=A0AAV8GX31_9POAL|nr:F-box protein skip23 [Rhynchospora pubera]